MQKIKKNLSAIQQKFQTLKYVHKNNEIPTKIGQVAEIMTYGVINENQVNQYLQKVRNESQTTVDENWMDMSIQSMILFFDKVIKHRNQKQPQAGSKKERRNILSWQKIKTKMSNKQAHQNPYRPHRVGKQGNSQSSDRDFTSGTMNFGSDTTILSHIKQKPDQSSGSQLYEEQFCELIDAINAKAQNSLKYKSKKSLQKQLNSDLPTNFANYSLQEKFFFLRTNYNKNKTSLQRKFDIIYTNYRKEMYIKRETFRTNENLMLDLKTFLKYYREFQIAKKYKVVEATNHFKKLAINGIWLNVQNFFQLHYLLAEIIFNLDQKELQQRLKTQNKQIVISKSPQSKELKRLLTKTTKIFMQNIIKLRDLAEIVSDEKVKSLLNDNRGKAVVKRIVEVHSGFVKEDILQRLKQRIQQKKKKSNYTSRLKSGSLKLKTLSPQKISLNKEKYTSIKANPSFRSIYRQLLLPNLAPSEMKNASIYSSLQLLNIHKQKEKLRQLISEDDDQKYLQAYFKKQKIFNSLFKLNNKFIIKTQSQTPKSFQLQLSNYKSIASKSQRKQSNVKKSLSLPRMRFT